MKNVIQSDLRLERSPRKAGFVWRSARGEGTLTSRLYETVWKALAAYDAGRVTLIIKGKATR